MSVARPGGVASLDKKVVRKPRALGTASFLQALAFASPGHEEAVSAGLAELERLGFRIGKPPEMASEGYFACSVVNRKNELLGAIEKPYVNGLVAIRGGYGSNYLLDELRISGADKPKAILGYSDLTSLQIYLWQQYGWVTFYAPMVAAGFHAGAGTAKGYDRESLLTALQKTDRGWKVDLRGEMLAAGRAEGRILGGCMTLVETTLGTPWELDTDDAILLLEDRGMKPWQVASARGYSRY